MTLDEYREGMEKCLSVLPEEFRGVVESVAYDRGHSCGYEEVLLVAQELADSLVPACRKFERRIKEGK